MQQRSWQTQGRDGCEDGLPMVLLKLLHILMQGVDVTGALPRKFVIDVEETLSALLSSEGSFSPSKF
jgi:hypothetical protein